MSLAPGTMLSWWNREKSVHTHTSYKSRNMKSEARVFFVISYFKRHTFFAVAYTFLQFVTQR
jgi:hypothetical protein